MNTIYIYCDGGFGNRFNNLLNGLFIAKYCNYTPKIIWPVNNWCGATFSEIFHSDLEEFKEFDKETFFSQHDTNNFMHWNPFQSELVVYNPMWIHVGITEFMRSQPNKDVFFFSSQLCPWIDRNLLRPIVCQLDFQQGILDIADSVIKDKCDNKEFFGIHLRCTDHTKIINLDDYLSHVANTPNSQFFICSDNAEVETRFMQYANTFKYDKTSYVEKLVEGEWNTTIIDSTGANFPYNVNRNSESVVQAMVDLIILSRSTLVETDFTSTFLQTAKLLQEMKSNMKLTEIHTSYDTDKGISHSYIETYDAIFGPYQNHNIKFLEIGALTCGSLRMFNDFLTKAEIYGVDNWSQDVDHNGVPLAHRNIDLQAIIKDINDHYPRIHLVTCDSTNKDQVNENFNELKFKFILDDGDHRPESQLSTFKNFIPYMADNGTYIIESVYGLVELEQNLKTYIRENGLPYLVKVVTFFKGGRADDALIIIR
jgi:hypothetical protein